MLILSQPRFFASMLKWQENTSSHCHPSSFVLHQISLLNSSSSQVWLCYAPCEACCRMGTIALTSSRMLHCLYHFPSALQGFGEATRLSFVGSGAAGSRAAGEWNRAQSNGPFDTQLHKGHCGPHSATGTADTHSHRWPRQANNW